MASTLPVDFFGRVAYILQNYSASLGRGVLNTMIIAVLATLAGCVIGLAVGIVQTIPTDRRRAPEGARAIGMTHVQTMVNVILPQALRNIMPQIGNNLIINIKDTCVLSCISVVELFFASKGVAGAYYWYFETYAVVMVFSLVRTFACSRLLRLID